MLTYRAVVHFCRAKSILQRFSRLEIEVNDREMEVIHKKQQLKRVKELSFLSNKDRIQKFISTLVGQSYQSQAIAKEKENMKDLYNKLEQLQKEAQNRVNKSNRLTEEEKEKREVMFLTDMARFANKFQSLIQQKQFGDEVALGVELSAKILDHTLQKEGVQFIGSTQNYQRQNQEIVSGQGSVVKHVRERGIKVRGKLIDKTKVQVKKQ